VHANARRRRKFIHTLQDDGRAYVDEDQKAHLAFTFFDDILGMTAIRNGAINLELLDLPRLDLSQLEQRFTKAEVWEAIKSLPPDKAPGPDGFTTRFLQTTWQIIMPDLMKMFDAFWHLDMHNLHKVNEALLTLLPKSLEAVGMRDYRPISLIHIIGKLISKVLANRQAPRLHELVHHAQSAFIKGRSIQDNFKLVHAAAKTLHVRKKPSLVIKIDIARAFDSVVWPFLLEVLQKLGFGRVWSDWVSSFLSSASTRVLMNGNPGDRICHARGLRQGDPLSPMMFVIVMDILNGLFRKADEWSLYHSLGVKEIPFRTSLYADDLAIFVSPLG
jgi:hypothetical protein